MSIQEYYEMAQNHTYRTPPHNSHDDLERKYWKSLSFVPPIYGADITDSITDPDCNVFNMAKLPSILQYVNQDQNESYAGVTTPYLYLGSWKTTFSWHVEDMDLYAINYLHFGMPKTWYFVAQNFMRHKTCLINPSLLDELGVPYQKVVQEVRNAIVVYPYAYHSGFNHGFNCAESTNFALERWIEYGKRYRPCDCTSNNVKINMDCFVKRFQPDVYDKWMAGNDIGPHPEDPPDVVALIKLKSECPETYAAIMTEKFQKEAENLSEKIMFYTSTGRNLAVFKSTLRLVRGDSVLSSIEKKEFEFWKLEQRNNSKIIFQEAGGPIVSVDRRLVHIYQHAELKQIKIKVLPRTLTIIGDGLALLKQSLPNERFKCVKELIDKGVLIKIGERQMKRKRDIKKIPDEPQPVKSDKSLSKYENNKKMIEKVVYELKHSYLDLKALVFSDNMNKYYGNHTDALTTFMEGSDMNTLVQSNIFTKVNEFKVFIEENDDIPIALGVKDDELKMDFHMTKKIPPKIFYKGRPKKKLIDFFKDVNMEEILASDMVSYKEDNCFYVYKAMAEYGKKAKESVKNRVKVHVIRWRNKILYRLALESEEIKCQECLTNEKFQDLINRRVLRESNCRRIHDINRLDKIIKCDLVPRKLFKFKVRGHPNQYVYTNLEQTEILIKLPEELRIMQKSPVEAMIKAEILYDGQEDDTISYEGLGALEEIIMSKTKSTEELNESQYEINHPLLDVHVVKNYRDNEMIIIKKIELKSILILDDDTKQEVNKVNELVKAESEEEIVPSTSNDFLIKEDEEVDEDDYDDIEESEDEIFIPEIEENSDDDKSCAFSDDDPDFKVNGNRNSIVMPGVRRRKRSQSKIRKTRGRGRGKGKKPRTTKTKGKETTTHSNIRSFNPVTILNSMSDQDEMKPYMNHVLNILESSKLIMKNQEEFVWTSNDIEEAVK
ncbi:KDM4 [Lepeophtheirus salmonis]|uniref:KDM4 n=1 Tax=Lepeophtheirus salmonis TaxID=72036 RepID=A0A7R8D1I4_LEPSM|nr:KDM4 [Lepeophtheirus salmonis]CAF2991587.1 KDM4 [Lepeophtheirus salmonis]